MNKEILDKANLINGRIKSLKTLKIYLTDDGVNEMTYWWDDLLRLFLPETLYNKLFDSDYEELDEAKKYDKVMCDDVISFIDTLIIKYENELKQL